MNQITHRPKTRTLALVFFLAALLANQIARADVEGDRISTRQTGESSFEITLDSKTVFDVSSAIRAIVPTARELCGDREVQPGRYTFDKSEAVTGDDSGDWFRLVQNIRCVDSVKKQATGSRTPQLKSEADAATVRDRVRGLSEDYFDRLYAKMGDDANAALAAVAGGENADPSALYETAAGTPVSVNLVRLTIYDNLPSAPSDGVYVAVDYDNRVGNVAHHCGYLMWHSYDTKEFKLGRIESGTLTAELSEKISEEEVSAVRKQLLCANLYEE